MAYPAPQIGGIAYFPLADNFVPYHYEDELRVTPLLGRDPAQPDRNEVLQSSARGAEVCTFAALAEGNAAKDALVALWGTQTTHDLGDGAGARSVAVVKVETALASWADPATPVYVVTVTTRTR
ncbi:MAG TPA: hypothetical protein VFC31_12990 [Candidatus Limnocylindria bacterium]|nr:hypothetical protein [Candidatus Limnocylindria bacterium]